MKKKTNFWCDADGFSITDLLSIIIVGSYVLSIFYSIVIVSMNTIDSTHVEFINSLIEDLRIPVSVVIGGYFTDQITTRIKKKKDISDDLDNNSSSNVVVNEEPSTIQSSGQNITDNPVG